MQDARAHQWHVLVAWGLQPRPSRIRRVPPGTVSQNQVAVGRRWVSTFQEPLIPYPRALLSRFSVWVFPGGLLWQRRHGALRQYWALVGMRDCFLVASLGISQTLGKKARRSFFVCHVSERRMMGAKACRSIGMLFRGTFPGFETDEASLVDVAGRWALWFDEGRTTGSGDGRFWRRSTTRYAGVLRKAVE